MRHQTRHQNGRNHGKDGGSDDRRRNRQPFGLKTINVFNDADAGRDKQKREVSKQYVDDGQRLFQKTVDRHQREKKEHHAHYGTGNRQPEERYK